MHRCESFLLWPLTAASQTDKFRSAIFQQFSKHISVFWDTLSNVVQSLSFGKEINTMSFWRFCIAFVAMHSASSSIFYMTCCKINTVYLTIHTSSQQLSHCSLQHDHVLATYYLAAQQSYLLFFTVSFSHTVTHASVIYFLYTTTSKHSHFSVWCSAISCSCFSGHVSVISQQCCTTYTHFPLIRRKVTLGVTKLPPLHMLAIKITSATTSMPIKQTDIWDQLNVARTQ